MRYYSYVYSEDDFEINKTIYSEEEILAEFWEFWSKEMRGNGYAELINKQACIDDWCALNWAQPEDVFRLPQYPGKLFVINEFDPTDPEFNRVTLICLNDNSLVINNYIDIRQGERVGTH
jgi:hypothetical protein